MRIVLLAAGLVLAMQLRLPAQSPLVFRDAGDEAGLFPDVAKIAGHGVGWGDVDGDGWPDLYVGAFGGASVRFQAEPVLPQRTRASSGSTISRSCAVLGRANGAIFVDLDNDGDLDLYATNHAIDGGPAQPHYQEPNHLFRNDGGGKFTDVSAESATCPGGHCRPQRDGDRLRRRRPARPVRRRVLLPGRPEPHAALSQPGRAEVRERQPGGRPAGGTDRVRRGGGRCERRRLARSVGRRPASRQPAVHQRRQGQVHASCPARTPISPGPTRTRPTTRPAASALPTSTATAWPIFSSARTATGPGSPAACRCGCGSIGAMTANLPKFEDVTERAGLMPLPMKSPHVEIQDFDNDGWPDIYTSIVKFAADGQPHPVIFRGLGVKDGLPRFKTDALAVNDFPTAEEQEAGRCRPVLREDAEGAPDRLHGPRPQRRLRPRRPAGPVPRQLVGR